MPPTGLPPAAELTADPAMPRLLPCGDAALCIEFSRRIDEDASNAALSLAAALEAARPDGVLEVVPTYRSTLVTFDPARIDGATLGRHLLALATAPGGVTAGRDLEVPVWYDGPACLDLDGLAQTHGIPTQEVIARHLSGRYRVYMIGFAPGFAYLGGLPPTLATPRKDAPRQLVPEGAIGIGGQQASINSVAGPSAWHFIGATPLRLFDPARARPFLLDAGDRIRFRRIDAAEFDALRARVARGETPEIEVPR